MHLPEVKVCGITRIEDAENALNLGASKLGFILYSNSPRCIKFEDILRIKDDLDLQPDKMVAVQVEPKPSELNKINEIGFGKVQLHFPYNLPIESVIEWSDIIGPDRLWLAPKLPNGVSFPKSILSLAETFLIDAYCEDKFGGTGKVSNWESFYNWKNEFNSKEWVLAGGLSPDNIISAINSTGAQFLDVNSGVEKMAGIKDYAKMTEFFSNISSIF